MSDDNRDDPPLDADDRKVVDALTAHDMRLIDDALMVHCTDQWKKVAMVVAMTMASSPHEHESVPDIFYGERVRGLVMSGCLEARGNLLRMRSSEIRRAGR